MNGLLVFQSDFGLCDGAVCAMYGVAMGVSKNLRLYDLTHDIPQYNIWEASYRLFQTISYWPKGTVFVSVVDPGVGSERRSVIVETAGSHYVISPDNGSLTHLKKHIGILRAREIDETLNRLPNSGDSYTFHGRDIFAYTGAKFAAGQITFQDIGPEIDPHSICELPMVQAKMEKDVLQGCIDILDIRFGNLWTNIPKDLFHQFGASFGDSFEVTIENSTRQVYRNIMTFGRSFADSLRGEPLLYINSLNHIGVAINQGSFADAYHIRSGANWEVLIRKVSQ